MREFSAMRPALRDPDAIGAFANAKFIQPVASSIAGEWLADTGKALFLLDFALLVGVLAMRILLLEFSSRSAVL
jgi:hypothetical protein